MALLTSIEDAHGVCMHILRYNKGFIDSQLATVGFQPLSDIIDHYTENLDNGRYPCLMVQEVAETTIWYGVPQMAYWDFSINIYGLIQHDDPAEANKIRRRFGAAVKDVLCRCHMDTTFNDHHIQFLDHALPVRSISYDVQGPADGNLIVKGFVARWQCQAVQPVNPILM